MGNTISILCWNGKPYSEIYILVSFRNRFVVVMYVLKKEWKKRECMCAMFSDEGERLPRVSQYKEALASTALPIIKMRRSHDSLIFIMGFPTPLLWRHNETDGVSNHQPHDCLLNRLFGHWSKKTSKLRVTGLCAGNSPVPGEFPAQMASNAENVSVWWRHHAETGARRF